MDDERAERFKRTLRFVMDNHPADEAADIVLLLMSRRLTESATAVAREAPPPQGARAVPAPATKAKARKKAASLPAPEEKSSPAKLAIVRSSAPRSPSTEKAPLPPFDEFTVEQSAEYLGIGRERLYQILQEPNKLPSKRVPSDRGRDVYRIQGRALNAYAFARRKAAQQKQSGETHDESDASFGQSEEEELAARLAEQQD